VAYGALVLRPQQKIAEPRFGRYDRYIGLHHVLGALDHERVRVQAARHRVSAPDELDGVDILARQQAAWRDWVTMPTIAAKAQSDARPG
jgi:hypothetical protein